MTLKQLAQRLMIASQTYMQGKAPDQGYAIFVIKSANMLMKAFPQLNPDYRQVEPDEDPDAMRRLDSLGLDEVPDANLHELAQNEAPEDMDIGGGIFD